MKKMQTLTKQNFWNEVFDNYPKATTVFCKWIDDYKESVNWDVLFNYRESNDAPKFHEIPYAFQQGIWIEFAFYVLNEYFEQPEYTYPIGLEEDINRVLSELEIVLSQE